MKHNGKKRIFIGLILISIALIALAFAITWYFIQNDASIGRWLGIALIGLACLVLVYALIGVSSLTISLLRGYNSPFLSKASERVAFTLLPLALKVGDWLGLDKDRIRASFIEVNNQLVAQDHVQVHPGELLILAPLCLQEANCLRKITNNIENCRKCGLCPVGDLVKLSKEEGGHLAVATGGTKARQLIKELRPKVVVAIACERDLVSGLQDSRPIVVKGITNQRPNGPCYNTQVDLDEVRQTVRGFLISNNS